jgi:flagellar motor protein MotB
MRTYQRGVLLGLTLAEVFILLLFIFLISLHDQNQISINPPSAESASVRGILSPSQSTLGISAESKPAAIHIGIDITNPYRRLVKNGHDDSQPPELGSNEVTRSYSVNPSENGKISQDLNPQNETRDANSGHNWPPIINITEADGFFFPTGSAVIPTDFENHLRVNVAQTLKNNILAFNNANIIEVFGHTDEQPKSGKSNLDASLIDTLNGRSSLDQLESGDNVGLGMARAIAVVHVLQSCPELTGAVILPYSAGQIINNTGQLSPGLAGDNPRRRRIEIRLRGVSN